MRRGETGFTLIEFTLVLLLMGVTMALVVPAFFRSGTGTDELDKLALWSELLMERSVFRGEVFLIEIAPREQRLRVMQPGGRQTLDVSLGEEREEGPCGEVADLVEVSDRFFPTTFELDEEYVVLDVQGPEGTKYTHDCHYVAVYPYGWVDPWVIHVEHDARGTLTGLVNPVTGRMRWEEGYVERIRDPDA